MKKEKLIITALIIISLLNTTAALAIKPLVEERAVDLPAEAEIEIVEEVEEVKEIVSKKTNLKIERIHLQKAKINEIIEITLKITNLENEELKIMVRETHRPGVNYLDPLEKRYLQYQALKIPYYHWDIILTPEETKKIKYHIKSEYVGLITFPPALAADQYGNTFASNPTIIEIKCNPNEECEPGESHLYCPEDCPTGTADDLCDNIKDGRCDPDCVKEADPDCEEIKEIPPEKREEILGKKGKIILGSGITLAVLIFILRKILRKKSSKK